MDEIRIQDCMPNEYEEWIHAFVVNTGESMRCNDQVTHRAFDVLWRCAEGFAQRLGWAEVAVITCGDEPEMIRDFCLTSSEGKPERFSFGGGAAIHAGLRMAIDAVLERAAMCDKAGIQHTVPWVCLISDGSSTDEDDGVMAELLQLRREGKVRFLYVLAGDAVDIRTLEDKEKNGVFERADERWLCDAYMDRE